MSLPQSHKGTKEEFCLNNPDTPLCLGVLVAKIFCHKMQKNHS
jgi:hypothetical protein